MARVTVEDCIQYVPNRFDLVILAAKRARQLAAGDEPMVSVDNDKFTVVALREIGEDRIDLEALALAEEISERAPPEEEYDEELDARELLREESRVAGVEDELPDEDDGFSETSELGDFSDMPEE